MLLVNILLMAKLAGHAHPAFLLQRQVLQRAAHVLLELGKMLVLALRVCHASRVSRGVPVTGAVLRACLGTLLEDQEALSALAAHKESGQAILALRSVSIVLEI